MGLGFSLAFWLVFQFLARGKIPHLTWCAGIPCLSPGRLFSLRLSTVSYLSSFPCTGCHSGKGVSSLRYSHSLAPHSQISTFFKYQSQPTSATLPWGQDDSCWVHASGVNITCWVFVRYLHHFYFVSLVFPDRWLFLKSQQTLWPSSITYNIKDELGL